jgi:FkbM family methyltransferase
VQFVCNQLIKKIKRELILPLKIMTNYPQKMNYSKSVIFMRVRSKWDIYRLNSCVKEPETVQWIEANIKMEDVFYDIGANVGAYSLVAYANSGKKCIVYAFEPGSNTFATLCENISLNSFNEGIFPIPLALDNITKMKKLIFSSSESGAASHTIIDTNQTGKNISQNQKNQIILCFTLDDAIKIFHLKSPTHIKIDVDGNELNVLMGAEATFSNIKLKSVLIEIDERNLSSKKIFIFMKKHNFLIWARFPKDQNKLTISNYIFGRA